MKKYIIKNGRKLRYGYTTGSCAAAAAKASLFMLLHQKTIPTTTLQTPKGWELELSILEPYISDDYACCCVQKDSGDDPDITNGIKIYAKVSLNNSGQIELTGGKGVGFVTREGLSVEKGQYAINPVPRKMIIDEMKKLLPDGKGVKVEISVPEGEEIGKKTFNPKLGIVGGISIIGTTGIVEPMSEEAFKESLALELKMLTSEGLNHCIFTPGNYGKDYCVANGLEGKRIIKISNFVGYMLEQAVACHIKKILLVGHIGKLVKVAGGIFHTHSRVADGRLEILTAYAALSGASSKLLEHIMGANTTEEAVTYIEEYGKEEVFQILVDKIVERCQSHVYDNIQVECILFSMEHGTLAMSKGAKDMKELFKC